MTPVGEVRPVPSRVTLNMEAVSSCHAANHPPHYIVSQPITLHCVTTHHTTMQMYTTFKTIRTKSCHVLWPQAREDGKVDFFVHISCLFSEIQLRYKHFNEPHTKRSTPKQMFNIPYINCQIIVVTETMERSTCVHISRIAKCNT
jgi:hypothetical protein